MSVYELLFGDQTIDDVMMDASFPPGGALDAGRSRMWEGQPQEAANLVSGSIEPWASFIVALARQAQGQSPVKQLRSVAENGFLEARPRLWAWTALRKLGEQPAQVHAAEVLGVVAEVPIDGGVDVLSAYADGSVRYLNQAGALFARETSEGPSELVVAVLTEAFPLLSVPPAPRDPEAPPPEPKNVRITALSARGIHRVDLPDSAIAKGGSHQKLFTALTRLLADTAQQKPA